MRRQFHCKQFWMDVAECIDALRIFPRFIVASFGGLLGYVIVATMHWYFRLPTLERTAQVSAVLGIIIPSLSGLAVWVYKIYSVGGKNWDAGTTSTTTTTQVGTSTATVATTTPGA
jgi:hypothetical protein